MNNRPQVNQHASLNRLAFSATVHCLTGCSIGEVLGMVIGTAFSLGTVSTIALSVVLAFVFGYLLTMLPLLRSGVALRTSLVLALASDTVSIVIMEIVDNSVMVLIPGAMDAGLGQFRFWGSLVLSLLIAGAAAFPVVRLLIARGRGHAVVHKHHANDSRSSSTHH
jgi:hypothetical protein